MPAARMLALTLAAALALAAPSGGRSQRAVSAGARTPPMRRQEWRRGTHECVRHRAWTPVLKSSAAFRAFPPRPAPRRTGYPFYLTLPAATATVVDRACSVAASPYEWWRWLAADAVAPNPSRIWIGPSKEYRRDPGMMYVTSRRPMRGIEFTGAFAGAIAANSDPDRANPKNAVTQAFFAHTRACYDGGPEIGFFRRLMTPRSAAETGNLLFYYCDVSNCGGRAGGYLDGKVVVQTTCKVKADGRWVSQSETPITFVPIPSRRNSRGGADWTYRAWAATEAMLRVEVRDPYSDALAWSADVPVAEFFRPYARRLATGEFDAHLTITIQKALDRDVKLENRGDLTPEPGDPPRIEVRSMGVTR